MFDVHCHMLPGMDDGSKDVATSIEMIRRSAEQGVEGIVFTPHFYAHLNSPEEFLDRRSRSLAELEAELDKLSVVPKYTVGAEVHYFKGISRINDLNRLCIGKSDYILIEMPFCVWKPNIIDEVEEISQVSGLSVIIAHVDRYLDQDKRLLSRLIENPDILIQCNADFFIERRTQSKALKILKNGVIDLIASDSHNLNSRKPNIAEAVGIIEKRDNRIFLDHIIETGQKIFEAAL